tara:strand:+ start:1762 stop:2337 length:576 start_codon:yes stop_codon:yes gene_type:complete
MRDTNKKGLSALISVVLLVAFVIILGLVITNWSTKLIKRNIEKGETRIGTDLECLSVDVAIGSEDIDGDGDIDIDDGVIFVKNNNLKNLNLSGFITRLDIDNKIFVDYKSSSDCIGGDIAAFGADFFDYSFAWNRKCEDKSLPPANWELGAYNALFAASPEKLVGIEVIPQVRLENEEVVDCVRNSAIFKF